jgi:hypothetical protein
MKLTSNDQRCEYMSARPGVWVVSPRDAQQEGCQATTRQQKANEIQLFDLVKPCLAIFPVNVKEIWWPVEDDNEN